MKKRFPALLCAAALTLSGCTTQIDYKKVKFTKEPETVPADVADNKAAEQETVILLPIDTNDKYKPSSSVVSEQEYSEAYQFEFNTEAQSFTTGLTDFRGTGFICLASGEYATIKVTVPSSQHYKIGLRVCTTGSKISVTDGGAPSESDDAGAQTEGVTWGAIYTGECQGFEYAWLDGVYLSRGDHDLTFRSLSGTAYIDELTIENSRSVQPLAYEVSNGCVNPNASDSTKTVKRYLTDVYGNKVLTGQFCSSGTNTEINAIYTSTGRYSAIRCADIGIFTEYYSGSDKNNADETDTAAAWWNNGGLVSYSWYWEAPVENTSCFAELVDFSIKDAYCDTDIALLSPTALEAYEQTGRVSDECLRLINDIDAVAVQLKMLDARNVPVLFRPLPEAGNGWYWWGTDSECYLWLYKLIFRRFNEYHGLCNLIWIWDGESADYYPGDEFVDIVGMDMYTDSDISGNSRMMDAISYTIVSKAAALTECGSIPDPDRIVRDNAYWLWFALWKGEYIIRSNGMITYDHVSEKDLDYAYNNELYITLDELPNFDRY